MSFYYLSHILVFHFQMILKLSSVLRYFKLIWGCRGGVVIKSIGCRARGPGFDSQRLRGGSQPPVTLAPGDPTLFCSSTKHMCGLCTAGKLPFYVPFSKVAKVHIIKSRTLEIFVHQPLTV